MTQKLLLTVEEVGQILSLGRTSVYKLIRNGELLAIKNGRRTLIPYDSVLEWLAAKVGAAKRAIAERQEGQHGGQR